MLLIIPSFYIIYTILHYKRMVIYFSKVEIDYV